MATRKSPVTRRGPVVETEARDRQTCPTCGGLIVPERAKVSDGTIIGQHTATRPVERVAEDVGPLAEDAPKRTVRLGSTAADDLAGRAPKGKAGKAK